MGKSVNGIIFAVAAVLFVPVLSHAAGLGNLTVHSKLGHPLVAEIEILSFRPGEENSLQVRLASREAFRDAGVEFNPALAGARLTLEKRAGKSVIRITTTQPVYDPFLNVLVEMQWPNGRFARGYTVLVDPVEYKSAAMAASESLPAQTAATAPAPAPTRREAAAAAPQPVPAPVVATSPQAAPIPEPRVVADKSPAQPASTPPVAAPATAAPTVAPSAVAAPAVAPGTPPKIASSTVAVPVETPAAQATPAQGGVAASTPIAVSRPHAAPERPDSLPQTASAASAPASVPSPVVSAVPASAPTTESVAAPAPTVTMTQAPTPTPVATSPKVESVSRAPSMAATEPTSVPIVTGRTVVASTPSVTPPMAVSPPSPSRAQTVPSATPVASAPPAPVAPKEASQPAKEPVAAPSPARPARAERSVADANPAVATQAAVPAARGAPGAAHTYRIRRGDTLGAIARRNRLDGVTYNQMLMALFRGNPDVFIRDNINLIRAGALIVIPSREVAVAIDAKNAYKDVMAHMAHFASYRRQLSATGATTSKRHASGQRETISRREVARKSARTM